MTKERQDQLVDHIVCLQNIRADLLCQLDEVNEAIQMAEEELNEKEA